MNDFSKFYKKWVEVYPIKRNDYIDFSKLLKSGWYLYDTSSPWIDSFISSDISKKFFRKVQVLIKDSTNAPEQFSEKKILFLSQR